MPQSALMAKNREFALWELEDAARLRALIKAYLEKNKITQADFMDSCGWSQSNYYQITKPERPLGIEAAAKLAEKLGVKIDDISPTIAEQIRGLSAFINHGEGYHPKTREGELSARLVDSMNSPKQRDKAVKIVTTIAEPEENGENYSDISSKTSATK